MSGLKTLRGALCLSLVLGLGLSFAAAADALTTLNDAALFKSAQKDVEGMPRAELDALLQALATCSAVSIGQRPQQFECERGITIYWAHYNRGRAIDNYMAALGGMFAGFDNNALNPPQELTQTYRHTAPDLLTLTKGINQRYRELDK